MTLVIVSSVMLWAGATLALSNLGWFRHRPLTARIRPYLTGASSAAATGTTWFHVIGDALGPMLRQVGEATANLAGGTDGLGARLARIRAPLDATAFRLRQLAWGTLGLLGGAAIAVTLRLPAPVAVLFILGVPALAALVLEQAIATRSREWQRRLAQELPVVSEQLAMLMSAGYSLGSALHRLAARGKGVSGQELSLVCDRMHQGLSETEALREWAGRAASEPLDRLVGVLALHRDGGDLSRLIAEEAKAIRRDAHRSLIETLERRAQHVWIPVTVATLVPGVIFIAVPFIEAMRLFAGS